MTFSRVQGSTESGTLIELTTEFFHIHTHTSKKGMMDAKEPAATKSYVDEGLALRDDVEKV